MYQGANPLPEGLHVRGYARFFFRAGTRVERLPHLVVSYGLVVFEFVPVLES